MATGTGLPGVSRNPVFVRPTDIVQAEQGTAQLWADLARQAGGIQNEITAQAVQQQRRAVARNLADQEISSRGSANDLREKHRYDPEGFANSWREYSDGILSAADPSLVPEYRTLLAGVGEATRNELLRERMSRDEGLAKQSVLSAIDLSGQDFLATAASGGDAAQVTAVQAKFRDKLAAAVNLGFMSQEEADRRMALQGSRAAGEAAVSQIQALYRSMGAQVAREAAAAAFVAGEATGLTAADAYQFRNRAERVIDEGEAERRRDLREAQAQAREIRMDLKEDFRNTVQDINAGARPSLDRVESLATQLERAGAPNEAERLRQRYASAQALNDFAARPIIQQETLLREAQGALDRGEIEGWLFNELRTAHDRKRAGLRSDPISTAAGIGTIDIEPFDFSAPADRWQQQIAERTAQAGKLEQLEGLASVSPFTAGEIDGLKAAYDRADVAGKTALVGRLASSLSGERLGATLEKIAGERPVMAWAGGLYQRNPEIAGSVIRGHTAAEADKKLAPAQNEALRTFVDDFMGSAMTGTPKARAAAVQAAIARYTDLSLMAGDASGVLDDDRMEQALRDVTGGTGEFNGQKVLLPPAMTEAQFEDALDALDDQALSGAVTQNGTPVTAEVFRDVGTLADYGDGRYLVQLGGRFVLNQEGRPFVLDMRRDAASPASENAAPDVEPRRRSRVPDAYTTGGVASQYGVGIRGN